MDDVERVFRKLVAILSETDAARLRSPIEIAEIYQTIVPYRQYRNDLGFDSNQDYEMAVLRLLSGHGGYASVDPVEVQQSLADEAAAINPNPGAFREYAAARVFLNAAAVETASEDRDAYAPPQTEYAPPVISGVENTVEEPAPPLEDPAVATTLRFTPVDDPPEPAPPPPPPRPVSLDEPVPAGDEWARPSVEGITTFDPIPDEPAAAPLATSCPSCTRALPRRSDLRYCPFCGMDVTTPSCRFCGAEVDPDWTFCVACGRRKADDE